MLQFFWSFKKYTKSAQICNKIARILHYVFSAKSTLPWNYRRSWRVWQISAMPIRMLITSNRPYGNCGLNGINFGQKSLHQPDLSLSSLWKLYISGGDKCRLWALRLITLNCSMPNCSIHSFMYDMGWNPVYKRHDHFVEITTLWHHFANQSKIWGLGETIQWWSPTWQNDQKYQTLASWKSSKLHLQYSIPHQLIWNIFKI